MIEIPGRIPVVIHPFFWFIAALIGWMSSGTLFGTFVWVGIIFVSVLFHEYGHALTALLFRQKAEIQLVALGGLTSFDGPKLKFWQQFLITFNGPLFGFLLFLLATFLTSGVVSPQSLWFPILRAAQIANLFWTIVNLLPVMPLDGGQLLRIVLESLFGVKGFKASLMIGAILSILFAFYFFIAQNFLGGALFFLFAFQSFDMWRKFKMANSSDREEEHRKALLNAELAIQEGKIEEAKQMLETVRQKAKGGVLAMSASQYLALLLFQEGKRQEAYEMLLPLSDLADEPKCLLHSLAAEFQNFPLVAKLSAEAYQIAPSKETALRNARAFARLKEPKAAGGWLQTAWDYGNLDLASILREEDFIHLQGNREFDEFIRNLKAES